jgi:ribosomal protein S18 acetylase RimI-like enzyme
MNKFFKGLTKFFEENIFFYHEVYLLEMDPLNHQNYENNFVEPVIFFSKNDLKYLLENGYSLGEFSILSDLTEKFFRSQLLFGIFLKKILVSISYLIIENKIFFYPPMKINFKEEGYIHYSITDPEYRGMGFYTYNLQKMSEFSADLGKKKLKMVVEKNNLSSLKSALNAGFEISGEGKYLMILRLIYWKEKYKNK